MHPVLQRADRFQDLLELEEHDAPYRFGSIFETEGWWARRHSKKKFKLLGRIDEAVRDVLEEDEEVHFLSYGSDTSGLEAYFLGFALYYLYRRAIVLTDRRILFLQINSRKKPGAFRSQLRYPAVAEVKRTLLRRARFSLRNGKSEVLKYAPRRDAGRICELVGKRRTATLGATTGADGVEQLCPHCYTVVEGRPRRCSRCRGSFRSARKAGLLSLLFPGFGDLYLGHRGLAVAEMLGAAAIWLVFGLGALGAAAAPEGEASTAGMLIMGGVLFAFVHGFDALATWYIGRKAIHPGKPSPEPSGSRAAAAG